MLKSSHLSIRMLVAGVATLFILSSCARSVTPHQAANKSFKGCRSVR